MQVLLRDYRLGTKSSIRLVCPVFYHVVAFLSSQKVLFPATMVLLLSIPDHLLRGTKILFRDSLYLGLCTLKPKIVGGQFDQ
jgi:hypothetical protein